MVVVVIITALSALAIPSIVRQMRDRRARQTAEELANVYRQARLRALGRGSAVLVRYANSKFTTLEAVTGGNSLGDGCTSLLPISSCTLTNWDSNNLTLTNSAQWLSDWAPTPGVQSVVYPTGNPTGTAQSMLDICFTPMGRALSRTDSSAALATMTGVPVVKVSRSSGEGLTRYVVIPPNGLARTDVAQ